MKEFVFPMLERMKRKIANTNAGGAMRRTGAVIKAEPQRRGKSSVLPNGKSVDGVIGRLFHEISSLITAARERVAVSVNTELAKLNWNVGNCIRREILGMSRAEYGKQVVKGLASRLSVFHGAGWDEKTLRHCLRAAETFCEDEIVSAARRQLSWTHIKNEEHVELLELGRSNIRVASYMTELPPKKVLEDKLRLAIETARNRLAAKG